MSVGALLVRLPDGTIRYGHYQTTVDAPYRCLHETDEQAEACSLRHQDEAQDNEPEPEVEVEIYAHYGGGFWWRGKARGLYLTDDGVRDFEGTWHIPDQTDGIPDWVPPDYC